MLLVSCNATISHLLQYITTNQMKCLCSVAILDFPSNTLSSCRADGGIVASDSGMACGHLQKKTACSNFSRLNFIAPGLLEIHMFIKSSTSANKLA